MRLLWELRTGPLSSRKLRHAVDGLSPSVLQDRMDELRGSALVELRVGGYALTELGKDLLERILPLHAFAETWSAAQKAEKPLRDDPAP